MFEDVELIFEDTKKTHSGVCFSQPIQRVKADTLHEVRSAILDIEKWQSEGYYAAGYIAYEAGWAFMDRAPQNVQWPLYPLVDFYIFKEKKSQANTDDVPVRAHVYNFVNCLSSEQYHQDISTIFEHLQNGDTYQVNYTQRFALESSAGARETYLSLREHQRVEYSAFLNFPELKVLSLSPELFLKKSANKILTKPMKGTAPRSADPEKDQKNKKDLSEDLKNRAENVMIVDLLRNDMGKIAVPGGVHVKNLFRVEEYETVYQMVSEIECEVKEEVGFSRIIESLFPCGSITGAPKLRTMEIISQLEKEPRGVYTGAIGYLEPGGDFCLNVAIRTLVKHKNNPYVLGVGGGILIDSTAEGEAQEVLDKKSFLTKLNNSFYIFETMLFDQNKIKNLDLHLQRMMASARCFAFDLPWNKIRQSLIELPLSAPHRIKLMGWQNGSFKIETAEIEHKMESDRVALSESRVNEASVFQRHKTSLRETYDNEHAQARSQGFYDVLYVNTQGHLVEASRHNIFLKSGGEWLTPPVSAGALPGIERGLFLKEMGATEKNLSIEDLKNAEEIILTNSLRGRRKVYLWEGKV